MEPEYTFLDEFENLNQVPRMLGACIPPSFRIKNPKHVRNDHTVPLFEFGERLGVTEYEQANTVELGEGYGNLVVLLQEPSDREDRMYLEAFLQDKRQNAVQFVNEALKFAFRDKRDILNTIVMDIRPFRPGKLRKQEANTPGLREKRDARAYVAFKRALNILKPDVILVCQCDKSGIKLGLPEELCSSIKKAGTSQQWVMDNGHETTVIYSVHPGLVYLERRKDYHNAINGLFHAAFVSAANILAGREMEGEGFNMLREIAVEAIQTRLRGEPSTTIPVQRSRVSVPRVVPEMKEPKKAIRAPQVQTYIHTGESMVTSSKAKASASVLQLVEALERATIKSI